MKRKWIWTLVAVVACTGIYVGIRAFTSESYLHVLPARPKALAAIDYLQLSKETGISGEEWERMLPDGMKSGWEGIDWTKEIYFFLSSKEYFGLLASVGDKGDLRSFFDKAAAEGRCTPVEESRGCCWTVYDGAWMAGFNNRALLVMGPGLEADMDALRHEMQVYFRQREEESGMSSPLFGQLAQKEASFRMASQLDILPTFAGEEFLAGFPEHSNLSDVNLYAGFTFSSTGLVVDAEISSENPEVNRYYEQLAFLGQPLDGDFADDVPAEALAWACVNVDGDYLLEALRKHPVVRTFLLGLNMEVDADMIIRSIKGDVAVTVDALAPQYAFRYLLTAQLENKDFLKEAAYWERNAAAGAPFVLRPLGDDNFCLVADGKQAYFGVKGNTLYVTPDYRMAAQVDGKETGTLSEWKDEIEDSRFFLWLNLRQLERILGSADGETAALAEEGGKLLGLCDAVVLRSSGARSLTLELRSRGNRNLLKEVLKSWTK